MAGLERSEAELFTDGGNGAVVRLPGQGFPGFVVQGDSPHMLRSDLAEVVDASAVAWPRLTRPRSPGGSSPRRCPRSPGGGERLRRVRPGAAWGSG
ncbi:DUF6959 family protein [Streptomyces sp. NPDC092370]|uniref:DUF6959 family protein n=1 Tax=Streptomyces sp. NPDC092370 TaxID=3366016 RepID=UPI00382AAF28